MYSIDKVVYPPPPPTSNNLSAKQRSLLLRKARKIEQLLGCPPHVLDTPHEDHTNRPLLPFPLPILRPSGSSRFSVGPARSSSTLPSSKSLYLDVLDTPYEDRASIRNQPPVTNFPFTLPILRPSGSSRFSVGPARSSSTLPSSKSSYLGVTAATSKPALSISPSDLSFPSVDALKDVPDLTAISDFSHATPTSPTFTSVNSHRKAKMDRIRKRLGSEVPLEVVFPDLHVISKQDDLQEAPPGKQNSSYDENEFRLNRPLPALPTLPDSSSKHSRQVRPPFTIEVVADFEPVDGKLSLIAECSDERLSDPRLNSPLSLRRSDGDNWGYQCSTALNTNKRPSSYRKPPPPIPDDLKALDLK